MKASDERLLCGNIKTEKTAYAISSEEWKNRERLEFERRREGSESRTRYNSFVRACCISRNVFYVEIHWGVGDLRISEPDNRIATLQPGKQNKQNFSCLFVVKIRICAYISLMVETQLVSASDAGSHYIHQFTQTIMC